LLRAGAAAGLGARVPAARRPGRGVVVAGAGPHRRGCADGDPVRAGRASGQAAVKGAVGSLVASAGRLGAPMRISRASGLLSLAMAFSAFTRAENGAPSAAETRAAASILSAFAGDEPARRYEEALRLLEPELAAVQAEVDRSGDPAAREKLSEVASLIYICR